jgi:putative ABC transport system substrate-binding protein
MMASEQSARQRGLLDVFVSGLKDHGWVEGQNVSFEYRFAAGDSNKLADFAAELVRLPLDAILADSTPATYAAKNATQTIPIIMTAVFDAVGSGFVESLNRPGGNITGTSILAPDLVGKRLQLLTEAVPRLDRVAVWQTQQTQARRCCSSRHKLRRKR